MSPSVSRSSSKTTGRNDPLLAGKTLAMIFEKPSLRTRVSFARRDDAARRHGLDAAR